MILGLFVYVFGRRFAGFGHLVKGCDRLLEIVNGPENVRFRQQLEVKTDPICRKCVCTLSVGRGRNLRR